MVLEDEERPVLRLFLFSSGAQFGAVTPKYILKFQIKIYI
jgi:hypothetical protein